ncbi:ATP-binding protein [candidate division KSB1 bacterium]|nr:ATP-binding protein [candidate division KSB1 bacterium]
MNKITLFFLLPALSSFSGPGATFAQPRQEAGKVFITNYSPKEYGAHPQNWAIVQDDRGVMYFGNNNGVLEYDGVSWRLIQLPNKSVARSLAKDKNGRIYVGGVGDFGYLAADSLGQMRYLSLLAYIQAEDLPFTDVWQTWVIKNSVYFRAANVLFRWADHRIMAWKPRTSFHVSFVVRDTLYVRQWQVGLMRMLDDSLRIAPNGERFAEERIYVMLPFDEKKILIGTREQGLFLLDGATITPFRLAPAAAAFLSTNQLYSPGVILSGDLLALGTLRGGLAIIDRQGNLIRQIDKAAGLADNILHHAFADNQDALWLAFNNGLARVEPNSPFTFYDEQSGVKTAIAFILRHRGLLYVATSLGVSYLQAAQREFRPVSGIASQSLALLAVDDMLLAATNEGVYRIDGDRAVSVKASVNNTYRANFLHRSRQRLNLKEGSARIFAGLETGLAALRFESAGAGGKWIDEGSIDGIHEDIIRIVEQEPGILWLGTRTQGVLRVEFTEPTQNEADLPHPKIERFGVAQGLPAGGVTVFIVADKTYFVSQDDIFRFDPTRREFTPDSTFNLRPVSFGGTVEEYTLQEDAQARVWINFGRGTAVERPQAGGSYVPEDTPLRRFFNETFFYIYPESDGVVWLGGPNTLIRHDPSISQVNLAAYPALIRRVTAGGDSVIFGGANLNGDGNLAPVLDHSKNSLRFEFSASSYEEIARNQFQTFLEGFDQSRPAGSAWSDETAKNYTNLPPGNYRFRVRARNVYAHESSEAVYAFKILPPWYRTWWAYVSYILAAGAVVLGFVRLRTRQLESRGRKLEQTVEERTAEIRTQKDNVELLSRIGKDITASLDFDTIFYKLYEHINRLADATIFGVGICQPEKQQIEYKLAIARGKRYAPYTRDTNDKNQFPVWCIENRQPVFINEVTREYRRYIDAYRNDAGRLLEDGTRSEAPQSLIYLPLIAQDRVLGVITIQSYQTNAYTEYHLNLLQNLAAYVTIALDNADAYRRLNEALKNLQATQYQLLVQEKLASLGQLTAGIAHEIKNPLNFVNNFAALSLDLTRELREVIDGQNQKMDEERRANLEEVLRLLDENLTKINHHGQRADSIVKGMLLHSRGESGERRPADINAILDEYVMLAFHGMRAQDNSFNIKIEKAYDDSIGRVEVVPQNLSRVFLNLINNAFYATHEKKKSLGQSYSAVLAVRTQNLGNKIEIRIRDNGSGIPAHIREKIFNPFFTTKPTGQGTGLGLSISYDIIVQEHKGEIKVETEEGEFTEFVISLPREIKLKN